MQAWDLNGPAPEEIGKGYDLVMACNTLHTGADIAGDLPLHCWSCTATRALMITVHCCILTGIAIFQCSHAGLNNHLALLCLTRIAGLASCWCMRHNVRAMIIIVPCCTLTRINMP